MDSPHFKTTLLYLFADVLKSSLMNALSCPSLKAMPHDNDLCNDIVDDATSTMEFNNDCNDIVEGVKLGRYRHNH